MGDGASIICVTDGGEMRAAPKPVVFSEPELEELKRLLLRELEQRGCAADPAATTALFKLVEAARVRE
jgi:hypothetical protein